MPMNLVQHRGAPNVWDRAAETQEWDTERWLAALLAGACVISGMRRRSAAGLALVVGGSAMAWWAAGALDERLQRRGQVAAALPKRDRRPDMIGEASEESFPASDAPSWTPTTGNSGPCATETTRWH